MKGFWSWFKSSTKMKRWIFLNLVGIILTCYAISKIIVLIEISIEEIIKIMLIFILGFSSIIVGFIFSYKRTLEMFIEASDVRLENNKNANFNSLIFNKNIYDKGPNIVVIGGGDGLNTVLKGLKKYTSNLTAIVTISDYGDSTKINEFNKLPLENIKNSLIAIAKDEEKMRNLLNNKSNGKCFSDSLLYAVQNIEGDISAGIASLQKVLNINGKILPVTLDKINICTELEDGTVITEKNKIPEVVANKVSKVSRIYISPTNVVPAPGVLEAIKNADCIIIAPGSLYTNVIPNLLVKHVSKTIKECKAIKIYVSNIMTEFGQTDNYTLSDHVNAIIEHSGEGIMDYCIYDTGEIVPEYIRKYNKEGADLVEQDTQKLKNKGIHVLKRNLSTIINDRIRHNPEAVATAIIDIICDDLRFKDKYNDPQYVMLNRKLKEDKRILRENRKNKKQDANKKQKEKISRIKRQSKFNKKYSERIESIQTSDENRIKRMMNRYDINDEQTETKDLIVINKKSKKKEVKPKRFKEKTKKEKKGKRELINKSESMTEEEKQIKDLIDKLKE